MEKVAAQWREAFWRTVRQHENADPLREAALAARLGDWTTQLTSIVVATCDALGWRASAKGHPLEELPISRSEYLALDVMAFAPGEQRWRFPTASFELENSLDDERIAYSLWKVLCVRADLRVVFCYRQRAEAGPALVRLLADEVVGAMDLQSRTELGGDTLVVVGSRSGADAFPYGFFKWWQLEMNTARFELMR